jgi:ribonucleoside-diphosphate reductase alpha chain
MFSLDLDHPDILEFLDAKLNTAIPTELSELLSSFPKDIISKLTPYLIEKELDMANISVRSRHTLKFIEAVKNDGDWELSWKGKYKNTIKARPLWERIVKNSYDCAEPGFLNLELALADSTISYIEELSTTNPCGEIFLSPYDCCCLGHLVLTRFVVDGEVDWDSIREVVRIGVRFLDNVLSVNTYPLPQMKEKSNKLRRIGLGTTGLADMLAMLGIRYGSDEGNIFIDKLFRFISIQSYESSVMLAIEKGAFPECKPDLHVKTGFVKRLPKGIKSMIEEHGIRNCAILTQAPVGTGSILSDNCTSGVEPMFAPAYWRTYWDGDVQKKMLCLHPLFAQCLEEGKDVSHFVSSHELSVRDHMEVQKTVQKHMDNAISKTINIPEGCPVEEISKLWLEYLPYLKGTTFYRTGSIVGAPLQPISLTEAKKLYKKQTIEVIKEAAYVDDCPNGVCDLDKNKRKII